MTFLEPQKVLSALSIFNGARVADLGCGPGEFALLSSPLVGQQGKVYALDIRTDILSRVKSSASDKGFTNIETLTADLEKKHGAHLADETCDFVIISNALFLAHHKDIFLEEAVRILKKGGKLLFIEWSESHGGLGPTPDMVVAQDAAQKLFAQKGLITLSEIPAGAYHYGYILSKP
jgi:ubiquinone/menaquinone biosynthesis C-methylase UbiE